MLRYEATLHPGTEAETWALIARPARWHEWAPHLRGAWGLDDPVTGEVEPGRRGAVKLLGAVPVPVAITAKDPGRSWTWRVGGVVEMGHRVEPGCAVIELRAPTPIEAALGATYGPLIRVLLGRLSRTGAARRPPTRTGSPGG